MEHKCVIYMLVISIALQCLWSTLKQPMKGAQAWTAGPIIQKGKLRYLGLSSPLHHP